MSMLLDTDDPLSAPTDNEHHHDMDQQVPSLEELVDACCLSTITNQPQTQYQAPLTPDNFQRYVSKSHCEENLQFLVQIYKYEFIWNQLFKRRSSILKCKRQISNTKNGNHNSTTAHSIHRTDTNTSMNQHSIKSSSTTTLTPSAKILIDKIDLKSDVEDISSFVNLKLHPSSVAEQQQQRQQQPPDSWNDFDHATVSMHGEDDHSGEDGCLLCNDIKDDADPQVRNDLLTQWNNIISNYITTNSPSQINLPSKIYEDILKESSNHDILYHSPEILINAKNFVLQLLRENVYEEFLDFYDKKPLPFVLPSSSSSSSSPIPSLKPSRSMGSLKTQFDKYEQKSTSTLASTTSTSTNLSMRLKTTKLHSVTNILPLVRGHTVHSLNGSDEVKPRTRGPCNVRVSEYSLYHEGDISSDCNHHHHHHEDGEEHHKKGWMRKLLKH